VHRGHVCAFAFAPMFGHCCILFICLQESYTALLWINFSLFFSAVNNVRCVGAPIFEIGSFAFEYNSAAICGLFVLLLGSTVCLVQDHHRTNFGR